MFKRLDYLGEPMHQSKHTLKPQLANLGTTGMSFSRRQSSTPTKRTMHHLVVNRQEFTVGVYHTTYSIKNSNIILILDVSRKEKMKILLEQTKTNNFQSYLKHKANYDRKAKATPLDTTDFCYILNPNVDIQTTRISFASSNGLVHTKHKRSFLTKTT